MEKNCHHLSVLWMWKSEALLFFFFKSSNCTSKCFCIVSHNHYSSMEAMCHLYFLAFFSPFLSCCDWLSQCIGLKHLHHSLLKICCQNCALCRCVGVTSTNLLIASSFELFPYFQVNLAKHFTFKVILSAENAVIWSLLCLRDCTNAEHLRWNTILTFLFRMPMASIKIWLLS